MFRGVCELLGIKMTRTTPFHPQSDGMVERFNCRVKTMEENVDDQSGRDCPATSPDRPEALPPDLPMAFPDGQDASEQNSRAGTREARKDSTPAQRELPRVVDLPPSQITQRGQRVI